MLSSIYNQNPRYLSNASVWLRAVMTNFEW